MLFLGIDAGTQGVRAAAVGPDGKVASQGAYAYPVINLAREPDQYEQSPEDWWQALVKAVRQCVAGLEGSGHAPGEIRAVSVSGTSGTLLPLGPDFAPLGNAVLYNDLRSQREAEETGDLAPELALRLGYRFGVSFSLPRMLWYQRRAPGVYEACRTFAHQADYLAGRLCGVYGVADYANAQKSGYDAQREEWPRELASRLGLDPGKLPRVVAPGTSLAPLLPQVAELLGLPKDAAAAAGATDAYAAILASGAVRPGDCASVIGTTFVCKAVSDHRIADPAGVAYPYRLPAGGWLVGGASNLGGRCLNEFRGQKSFEELDREAEGLLPTGVICYPLFGKGERFPFSDPKARGFYRGNLFGGRLYPALMEGVGFGERLCYERLAELGCPLGESVRAAGGASRSGVWLRIRASILNRPLLVPEVTTSAMGSAILAACGELGGARNAVDAMAGRQRTVEPDPALAGPYEELYREFRQECRRQYGI